ncbi:protein ITPRID2-like isoform X1 [Cyprinodon tularosa]|uniref:protein ITPRID2-like isoform X1 n=2 Tax=Cyprinodon tularosa TaxID=77115 RepID=UPI0018E1E7B3|nr:protein ITPRID2-like isoform X1 [Cyprinodon tularosa]
MASSCLSSSTWKTVSSVSEVLQIYSEDAEETLYELGFGCEEPQVTVRIPPRFFTFPSQAQGINFRLFLDAQIRRIREEDPSLSLASRFRQVQVLTAMANAFYSLYSHVSRTPLQKLATPEFTFSSPVERMERFRTSIRSEPRSPVERLKDTVNKMCLYTGSPRGSESTSPQPSPRKRSSLPEVVDIMLRSKTGSAKKLDLGGNDRCGSCGDLSLLIDSEDMEKTQLTVADTDFYQRGNKSLEETLDTKHADNADNFFQADDVRTSLTSSLSGETVIETATLLALDQDSCLTPSDTRTGGLNPGAKVAYDLVCPQIVESVHRAPFSCQNKNRFIHITQTSSRDRPCSPSQKSAQEILSSEPDKDQPLEGSGSHSVQEPSGSSAPCSITVTGLEDEDVFSTSINSCRASPASSKRKPAEPFNEEEGKYLNPLTHPSLGKFSGNHQHVNSFELEEVHSAGEEDFGQPDTARTVTSSHSRKHSNKGEVVRGDSMQSDSSGYADEEVIPSPDRHSR